MIEAPVSVDCFPSFCPRKHQKLRQLTTQWRLRCRNGMIDQWHHQIIHVGAGPIQLANGLQPVLATDAVHHKIPISLSFREFSLQANLSFSFSGF